MDLISDWHLDYLLENVCEQLQLSDDQFKLAEARYKIIGNWLSKSSELSEYNQTIYPQGSFNIGTTVKPINKNEFDLDLIFELNLDPNNINPRKLLNTIYNWMLSNDTYKKMTDPPRNRCIRVNYQNDFHLDIVPACTDPNSNQSDILIPDKQANGGAGGWKNSNPKQYAGWFENKCIVPEKMLEKAAEIESLPAQEYFHKKAPLKLVVQLIKRWRDIGFEKFNELSPSSIVITTLVAENYNNERRVVEAFNGVVKNISQIITNDKQITVRNPKNQREILSEKWDSNPESYRVFVNNFKKMKSIWENIYKGVDVSQNLTVLFGEKLVKQAYNNFALKIEKERQEGKLKLRKNGGLVTGMSGMIQVQKNTFYGK